MSMRCLQTQIKQTVPHGSDFAFLPTGKEHTSQDLLKLDFHKISEL